MSQEVNKNIENQERGLVLTSEEINKIGEENIRQVVKMFSQSKSYKAFHNDEMLARDVLEKNSGLPIEKIKKFLEQIIEMTKEAREKTHEPSYKMAVMHKINTGQELPQKTKDEKKQIALEVDELVSKVVNKILGR